MYDFVQTELREGVQYITFMRPEQLNAMNRQFMDEIAAAFEAANKNPDVRVVVVTGSGRAFMSGADIKEYAAQTDEEFLAFQQKGWSLYHLAEQGDKPYIAAVNGFALGGGFEIAAACDMVIAADTALFGLPEVHLGLVPGGGGTQRLVQKFGINRVREMLYLGGRYTARQMYDWGMVNYVLAADDLMRFSGEIAEKLVRRTPQALAALKKLAFLSTRPIELDERMKDEGQCLFDLYRSPEAKEKIQAFQNK